MSRDLRSVLRRTDQPPTDRPWWRPVGLWQSWWGVAFLAVAAVLTHWP